MSRGKGRKGGRSTYVSVRCRDADNLEPTRDGKCKCKSVVNAGIGVDDHLVEPVLLQAPLLGAVGGHADDAACAS